ncbi:hypothetical protein MF271_11095 [Deinococcus sp. KNUC1210]|uniref:B3/B4 domain-containing protein n=1 Tax=Deinococcus sp. KNUC1210 TaxID=2917691 RepID=UPI001EF0450D|nr:phenylalanine--tRNA ligase beta subunit-related protein [Deinococcus sp. KNUC1210]ULH14565.1 hypothetical protein MF271_11095 [Deinococcus sp. KNUC1210]
MNDFLSADSFLSVSPALLERFPTYRGLVLIVRGLHNGPSDDHTRALLREAEAQARRTFAEQPLAHHPHLSAWRDAYRAFGVKPNRMSNSAEALISRVLKGGELPTINQLVDLYNAVSVRYAIPCGGEDLSAVAGRVTLSFARGDEPFETVKDGSPATEFPIPGEVVWADEAGVTCRAWNWRQGTRTRITEDTRDAYFLFDTLAPLPADTLRQAGDELETLLRALSPACVVSRVMLGHPA